MLGARRSRPSRHARVARAFLTAAVLGLVFGAFSQAAGAKVIWLCKPGQQPDPCTPGLSTTVFSPQLKPGRVEHPKQVKKPAIDCFYVYPTVSDQKTLVANRDIDPEERSIALFQAARYSQYCRVFAPIYRQLTLAGIAMGAKPSASDLKVGPSDVREAFRTYLQKYNHGRGFVLIGHSQGSFVLRTLIAKDVDPKPAVRERLISAILMGGNVLVKNGKGAGGDFQHISACRSAIQLGCVIAFSTFDQPPPADSLFGRTTVKGEHVLCTNPAALGGGSGMVTPILPSKPFAPGTQIAIGNLLLHIKQPMPSTVWSTEPGSYSARCSSAGGANVLQLRALHGAQVASPSPTKEWGLHLLDANIALGNLIAIVKREAVAFAIDHRALFL
jgi:Protein of unknown function (DUF3089)